MSNKNIEILRGDPKTSLVKLSIPIMVTVLVTTLYNIIDGMWIVGLGIDAVAGIGLVTPLWMIINGVAIGLGNGITSSITRFREKYGDKKSDDVASQSIIILIGVSIVLTAILLVALNPFLSLYSSSPQVNEEAIAYSVPLFLGLFGFVFANGCAGILRAEGDTKRAMYALIFGLILNAALDPVFIYVLNWGSAGASISTVVTSILSAIIIFYWIFIKKDTYVHINIENILKFRWDRSISKDILATGIPASAVLYTLSFASMIFYFLISMVAGKMGVSIFASGNRIYLLGLTPITAMCSALVPIIGTQYGAGNIDAVKRAHTYCCLYSFILGAVICPIFIIFKNQIAFVFLIAMNSPQLLDGIAEFVAITSLCIPFLAIGLPSSYIYQGLGKGIISFYWTVLYELIFTFPAIYLFGFVLGYGLTGVWIGLVAGRGTVSILNFISARFMLKKLNSSS